MQDCELKYIEDTSYPSGRAGLIFSKVLNNTALIDQLNRNIYGSVANREWLKSVQALYGESLHSVATFFSRKYYSDNVPKNCGQSQSLMGLANLHGLLLMCG